MRGRRLDDGRGLHRRRNRRRNGLRLRGRRLDDGAASTAGATDAATGSGSAAGGSPTGAASTAGATDAATGSGSAASGSPTGAASTAGATDAATGSGCAASGSPTGAASTAGATDAATGSGCAASGSPTGAASTAGAGSAAGGAGSTGGAAAGGSAEIGGAAAGGDAGAGAGAADGRSHDRQERERVEVALGIRCRPDAEVEVGPGDLRRPARPDRADDGSLGDRRAPGDRDRAEMGQRDRETVRRVDRDRLAARRHRAREADDARRGCEHRQAGRVRTDVDAAVLPARVRMRRVEREALEHRAAHGPRPRARSGHPEHEQENDRSEPPHRATAFVVRFANGTATVAPAPAVVNSDYSEPR